MIKLWIFRFVHKFIWRIERHSLKLRSWVWNFPGQYYKYSLNQKKHVAWQIPRIFRTWMLDKILSFAYFFSIHFLQVSGVKRFCKFSVHIFFLFYCLSAHLLLIIVNSFNNLWIINTAIMIHGLFSIKTNPQLYWIVFIYIVTK